MFSRIAVLATFALGLGISTPALAQLVIDGETITSAETLAAGQAEGKFIRYGVYPPDAMKVIDDAFTADTGITVEFIRMSTNLLFQRIVSEAEAGRLEADIIDLTDIIKIHELVTRGILNVEHRVPSFDALPDDLKDPQGRWYSYFNPIWTVAVNTARIPEADFPKSWADLLDPKYDGQLAVTNVDGGSGLVLFSFLRDKISKSFWTDLAARHPRVYESVSPLIADLARGDIGIAPTSLEVAMTQIAKGAPLKTFFFAEGTPAFPIAGGITTTASHPNAAKVFFDWITSKRGGDVVAKTVAFGINPASANLVAENPDAPIRHDQLWLLSPEELKKRHITYREEWRALFQ